MNFSPQFGVYRHNTEFQRNLLSGEIYRKGVTNRRRGIGGDYKA
jgi:hypothetical protein